MANGMTVAVTYWSAVGAGKWMVIGCGMGWPGNDKLVETIRHNLEQGRRVFIDADPKLWGRLERVTQALPPLEDHFRFSHVIEEVYEIYPADHRASEDDPNLGRLVGGPDRLPDVKF